MTDVGTPFDWTEIAEEQARARSAEMSWEEELDTRALDELFVLARQYQSSKEYLELLGFAARFRQYAPFNAKLV